MKMSKAENNKKVCPFKKRVKFMPARIYQETFACCDGKKCMAYRDGICLRLELWSFSPITYRGGNP